MLFIISGNIGSGKTLFTTIIAFFSRDRKIISNYKLYGIKYEEFSISKFVNCQYNDCIILVDEMYNYVDSRNAMSTENRFASYALFQSRKKNVDIYGTVQLNFSLDIRFRGICEYVIECEEMAGCFKYTIFNPRVLDYKSISFLSFEEASTYFNMYDTNEVIQPKLNTFMFLSKEEQRIKVFEIGKLIYNSYISEFREKYPNKRKIQKITQAYVRNWLFNNNFEKEWFRSVYDYVVSEFW